LFVAADGSSADSGGGMSFSVTQYHNDDDHNNKITVYRKQIARPRVQTILKAVFSLMKS